jgi:hypothetical protein
MKAPLYSLLLCLMLSACNGSHKNIPSTINLPEFPGFEIKANSDFGSVKLSGYEYKSVDGKTVAYNTCAEATNSKETEIAEYELFRYRLLINSCHALKRYLAAKPSTDSFFPSQFDASLVRELPATSVPLLNKTQEEARTGKTVNTYFANGQLSLEKNGSVKLQTVDDEIIYTLLARGDLTNDGIEDLLVRTEWYARKASGKHVDLLVLSKTGQDKAVTIEWRLMSN